jgi:hypothetical protein
LLESPIFVHLRLQLLDVEATYHTPLLKSVYGILMCLPQGDAFRLLNERLATVCNLRDSLGVSHSTADSEEVAPIISKQGLDMEKLLVRFDDVSGQHSAAINKMQKIAVDAEQAAIRPQTSNDTTVGSPSEGAQVLARRRMQSPRQQQEGVVASTNSRNINEQPRL